MMQEQDLQELAELVNDEAPILSLYLNVDRRSRSWEEHKPELRNLLAQAVDQGAAAADVERIERFFEHEYDRQGRSVACFSCQALRFWRGYALLVPMRSAVFVGRRPYIKPLSDVWDNYQQFAVLAVDSEGARAFVYQLGALVDTAGTLGTEVKRHKQGGWAAQKLQRYEDQEARHNLKYAAEWAQSYLEQHKVTRVVLSGTEQNLAGLRGLLPRPLQDKVVGQISLDMNASPLEVWERAFDVAQLAQRRTETDLLQQITTLAHKGGPGAIGLADTLAALEQGRVYQLVIDPALHAAGSQCAHCRAVVIEDLAVCPYCSGKLIASADVVNLAVHRAIDAGLKVSVMERSPQLSEAGGIAALLRY